MLGSVPNNQEQDKTDKSGGDSAAYYNITNTVNYKLKIEGD